MSDAGDPPYKVFLVRTGWRITNFHGPLQFGSQPVSKKNGKKSAAPDPTMKSKLAQPGGLFRAVPFRRGVPSKLAQ